MTSAEIQKEREMERPGSRLPPWGPLAVALAALTLGACNCGQTNANSSNNDGGPGGDGGPPGGTDGGTPSQHVVPGYCPGCPAFPGTPSDGGVPPLGAFGNTPACAGSGVNPTLIYPNDGALYPPNTNALEVQFFPGARNTLFEVDFENSITDVRVEIQCNAITNQTGQLTGGCGFTLDPTVWSYIAANNAGGDPVTVTVRGTPDGSCVAGSNSRTMLFASQPIQGAIYYWQSVVSGTMAGTSGGIYRYSFGTQAASPSAFVVPSSTSAFANRCLGCHFISRDGRKMTFGNDDNDADDEYSDLSTSLLDVAAFADGGTVTGAKDSPGFQTFSPDHSLILASDGLGKNSPPAFYLLNEETGAAATPATVPTGARATQPDWSADGSRIVFVAPGTVYSSGNGNCNSCSTAPPGGTCPSSAPYNCQCTPPSSGNQDDNHFSGGSIFTMSVNGTTFSQPSLLLASTGENNYYPAFSPDGAFVVFNRVIGPTGLAQDAFSNPKAGVWVVPASGSSSPVELKTLELAGVAADSSHPFASGGLTNSWPRFSPFVTPYRGKNLYWLTFSSTRDYGLRVQNQATGEINCFPPESPENACSGKQELVQPNCAQPQIWMAAVTEDGLATGDTSYPAFWLPFQSVAAHNHIAQWATTLVGAPAPEPSPDAGTCGTLNASCAGGAACCPGFICVAPSYTCQSPLN